MLLDAIEVVAGIFGAGINSFRNRKNEKRLQILKLRNDALLNLLINIAFVDQVIKAEEKSLLEQTLNNYTFYVYGGRKIDWCIEHAIKYKMSIPEIVKAFANEDREEQCALFIAAVLIAGLDDEFAQSELQILRELEAALKITPAEKHKLFEDMKKSHQK